MLPRIITEIGNGARCVSTKDCTGLQSGQLSFEGGSLVVVEPPLVRPPDDDEIDPGKAANRRVLCGVLQCRSVLGKKSPL